MKKGISLVMALLLIWGSMWVLASCMSEGETGEQSVKPGGDGEQVVPGGSEDNGDEQTGGLGDSTDTPVISSDWVIESVWEASSFQDGIAFVRYTVKNEKAGLAKVSKYALDTTGKILFELPNGDDSIFPEEVKNGTMVIDYRYIYDTKGTQIASPESKGYDWVINRAETQFLVCKEENSFSGNSKYYGVLDHQGEWILPLTSDHSQFNQDWAECALICDNILLLYNDNEELIGAYHLDTKEITPSYEHIIEIHKYSDQNKYAGYPLGIYKCDENGNLTMLLPDYSFDADFRSNGSIHICCKKENDVNHYIALDRSGNILVDYGTKYNLGYPSGYHNGYLLCSAYNPAGDLYIALVTPEGELAFDPISQKDPQYGDVYWSALTKEGFITYVATTLWGKQYTLHDYHGNAVTFPKSVDDKWLGVISDFSCGLAYAGTNYYINTEGEIVIDLLNLVIPE